jgi:hypothetical protein
MGKIIEAIKNLFPILQPEWVFCEVKDVPVDVLASFYEEEEYQKRIGKSKMDIKIKGYRYKLTPKKEIFMMRRKVSLI